MQYTVEEVGQDLVMSVSYKRSSSMGSSEWGDSIDFLNGPSHNRPVQVRTVKAGSVEKLVECLAPYGTETDVSYRMCFLATYRTFLSPSKLLQLLVNR